MALTPTGNGQMRIDPVPLAPRSDRDAFAYDNGTPGTTYQALLRIALDDEPGSGRITSVLHDHHPDGSLVSQLREAISTTIGPLRLSWPQLRLWARADRKAATRAMISRWPDSPAVFGTVSADCAEDIASVGAAQQPGPVSAAGQSFSTHRRSPAQPAHAA